MQEYGRPIILMKSGGRVGKLAGSKLGCGDFQKDPQVCKPLREDFRYKEPEVDSVSPDQESVYIER